MGGLASRQSVADLHHTPSGRIHATGRKSVVDRYHETVEDDEEKSMKLNQLARYPKRFLMRKMTMDNSLAEINFEVLCSETRMQEEKSLDTYKLWGEFGAYGFETAMVKCKVPKMKGWAKGLTSNMEQFDPHLLGIMRSQKSTFIANPKKEIIQIIGMSLISQVTGFKLGGSAKHAARKRTRAKRPEARAYGYSSGDGENSDSGGSEDESESERGDGMDIGTASESSDEEGMPPEPLSIAHK
jgi:hypothetical protein